MQITGIPTATLLKALADPTRLRIVNLLGSSPLCVCNIEQVLGISQTATSRHLARLQLAGILKSERRAQWVYYSINSAFLRRHAPLMEYLEREFREDPQLVRDRDQLALLDKAGSLCSTLETAARKQPVSIDN
jgi:ArsR family transcriptional regulator, arsenate/arsenite/antimonite-responsive transcriptional repressor